LQQNRLRWYEHVLRKDDDGWVKKCMEYEVEGSRPRGRPNRTWKEVFREDCQARKLNKEGREYAFSSQTGKILKVSCYRNYCIDFSQTLHNEPNFVNIGQILTVDPL